MIGVRGFILIGALALSSVAGAQSGALGLSKAQLEDADLIDATGVDIGDVEYAIIDKGRIVALAIEVDRRDSLRDKLVSLPLQGLRAVSEPGDPGDFNIVTAMSAADVTSLPAISAHRH